MADPQDAPTRSTNGDSHEHVLLVIFLSSPHVTDSLVTALVDMGLSATLIESKGLMTFLREEMPIFSGLAALMPQTAGNKVLLCATTRSRADEVCTYLTNEIKRVDLPIAIVLPVARAIGLRD